MKIQPNSSFWQNEPKFLRTVCLALNRFARHRYPRSDVRRRNDRRSQRFWRKRLGSQLRWTVMKDEHCPGESRPFGPSTKRANGTNPCAREVSKATIITTQIELATGSPVVRLPRCLCLGNACAIIDTAPAVPASSILVRRSLCGGPHADRYRQRPHAEGEA
jgi:hypothetical protein